MHRKNEQIVKHNQKGQQNTLIGHLLIDFAEN